MVDNSHYYNGNLDHLEEDCAVVIPQSFWNGGSSQLPILVTIHPFLSIKGICDASFENSFAHTIVCNVHGKFLYFTHLYTYPRAIQYLKISAKS